MRSQLMRMTRGSLYRRVFLLNAAVFVLATLALTVTPATISFPVEATEAIVLVVGLGAILVLNAFALRTAFAPLDRLTRLMSEVDLQQPRERLEVAGTSEVRELVGVFNDMLDRLETERRESSRRALAAQEGERWRVAQELHDDVGQVLTGVLLRLESLAGRAPTELLPDVRATQDATRDAIERISLVVRQLRPEALTDLGLAKALAALVTRVSHESGLRISHEIRPDLGDLGDETELVIYRVAQESLTNVARHSQATNAELTLERTGDAVILRIRDNGVGLPQPPQTRHGILGMRERAMLIEATLLTENLGSGGAQVTLTAPLDR
ncbi:histidine kinase [Gaiella sp.]|uniref:sensor histidine kinase n=1 Tax=Gaiella sp. TaxID=2663207 RepID=UPI0032639466